MARKNEAHEIVVESITDALLILMKKKPLSEINVSELCNKAGVSRVSFYRNFTSLEDILLKYLKKCTDDWWVEFSKKSEEEIQQTFWPALLSQYKNHTELIGLLKKNDVTHILKDHIFSCCGPKPEHDEKSAYICACLAGLIYGFVDEWIKRGMNDKPPKIDIRKMIALADGI